MAYEKLKKKYALNNSYFKNRQYNAPSNPFEILEYFKEHNELPYDNGSISDNWIYECFTEYQKRVGVYGSQFFTPLKTANRMAELADTWFDEHDPFVLDACCGFGMLSKSLRNKGFIVKGFDIDINFKEMYNHFVESEFTKSDFREYQDEYQSIISNPPYEVTKCINFLENLHSWLLKNGVAILLLPKGFVDKERPKNLVNIMQKFDVIHREDMTEEFERTKARAEIIILRKV